MVKGLDLFRKYFSEYTDQYTLIGGTACDFWMEDAGINFRATKDLDIVLIVEALSEDFGKRFWQFISDGGYTNRAKSNGGSQFYRFEKPTSPGYPFMIELFSRYPNDFLPHEAGACTPLHLSDEISSLSAILLNADYYQFLLDGRTQQNGINLLPPAYLIPFKTRAWIDLSRRKADGDHIDSRDIQKHKNDVFRLSMLLSANTHCLLAGDMRKDMENFLRLMDGQAVDLKALGIRNTSAEEILRLLGNVYLDAQNT